jgi:hypothetical protein
VRRNDAGEQYDPHKEEKAEGEIVQERIGYHVIISRASTTSSNQLAADRVPVHNHEC